MQWKETFSKSGVTDATAIQFMCKSSNKMINSTESAKG